MKPTGSDGIVGCGRSVIGVCVVRVWCVCGAWEVRGRCVGLQGGTEVGLGADAAQQPPVERILQPTIDPRRPASHLLATAGVCVHTGCVPEV